MTTNTNAALASEIEDAFVCARSAFFHCADWASTSHALDVLRTRVDVALTTAAAVPPEGVDDSAPGLSDLAAHLRGECQDATDCGDGFLNVTRVLEIVNQYHGANCSTRCEWCKKMVRDADAGPPCATRSEADRCDAMLAVAPKAEPVVEQELREGASYESMNLAKMVLSDCCHSSNYEPLLERVAGRIDRHVERLLTAQHADSAMRAQAAPADVAADHPPMPETWHVVASVHGESTLSIGYNWVSGKCELNKDERQAIVGMAQHLLAFVGYGLPPSNFDPDSAEAAPAAVAGPSEADLPDVEDMAHSAVQEAMSFGVSHDVFHRWMRAVMDKTVAAILAAAPTTQAAPAHPDDAAVDALAATMKAKLAKQRAKGYGGWDTPECTQQRLSDMLRAHVDKGDPVDVANFCAFLAARGEGIAQAAPAAQGDAEDAARWRETLMHVGAAYHLGGQHFTLNTLHITDQMFLLRGSVAQHFTKCIDASRAARSQAKEGA